ncbi:Beta-fructofuranosidase [Abeliophyllum distichum]|uniref:Beta-fructofuranosidase n=1 Tax=Abeliophyllum distichum TaxID=126358 RepID=A0ABD1RFH1_9LAMI
MYYNGFYHLFYQYNPKGSVWGNIVWAHSVSKDLINWKKLEPAIFPSKKFDKYGCWSGSATVLPGNKPIILYTGVVDENMTEVQNYAVPADYSDPHLRKWIKPDNNPLIVADLFVNSTAFRDPTTAWLGRDGNWKILVGSRRKHRGIAYLYTSRDFKNWVKAKHPLHSSPKTGNWECPDFFPVSVHGTNGLDASLMEENNIKHVLKVSLDRTRYDYYTLGTYYHEKERYIPDKNTVDGLRGLRYDHGNFYASKSFFDPIKKRRILWAWSNESDTVNEDVEKGWAGILTIPRTILIDPNGRQLLQWPVEELETLRGRKVKLRDKKLKKGEHVEVKGITAAQADVEVTFSFHSLDKAEKYDFSWDEYDAQKLCSQKGSTVQGGVGPFGILTLASEDLKEYTPVFFRIFKAKRKHVVLLCSDASSSSLSEGLYKPSFAGFVDVDLTDKKLSLRTLIDHSVVESFGAGGRTCITSRVYPTLAMYENAHLHAFNNGTETIIIEKLDAWSMNSPRIN